MIRGLKFDDQCEEMKTQTVEHQGKLSIEKEIRRILSLPDFFVRSDWRLKPIITSFLRHFPPELSFPYSQKAKGDF